MGTSVLMIRMVGNHGCQRKVGDGGTTAPTCDACTPEQAARCTDAVAKRAVEMLKATGSIVEANLLHWPEAGGDKKILDDLVSGKRFGSF